LDRIEEFGESIQLIPKDRELAKYIAEREKIIAKTKRLGKISGENKKLLEVVRCKIKQYLDEIDHLFERFPD
jgi:hypothetical protein